MIITLIFVIIRALIFLETSTNTTICLFHLVLARSTVRTQVSPLSKLTLKRSIPRTWSCISSDLNWPMVGKSFLKTSHPTPSAQCPCPINSVFTSWQGPHSSSSSPFSSRSSRSQRNSWSLKLVSIPQIALNIREAWIFTLMTSKLWLQISRSSTSSFARCTWTRTRRN